MRKMIFLIGIILSALFYLNVHASAECELVMDADSGRVLYSKNIDKKRLIASTTKIMTTLVVLNNSKLDEVVTVGDEVLDAYGSAIYIKPKEKLTIRELLYGLMLRSGNDAAIALAVHVAGSVDNFALLMNETANKIGMNDTVFSNPHGLDEDTKNTSTVYDMALLMREAMKNNEFRKITSSKEYTVKTNFNTYVWYNKNKLLSEYKYATGGKIGYTKAAGHTFVSAASKDGKNLIIATFLDSNRFVTHKSLYEKYFDEYIKYTLIDKDYLNLNYKRGYKLFTKESYSMLLNKNEVDKVNREVVFYNNVKISDKPTIIGTISIILNKNIYKRLNIYAIKNGKTEKKGWIERISDYFR